MGSCLRLETNNELGSLCWCFFILLALLVGKRPKSLGTYGQWWISIRCITKTHLHTINKFVFLRRKKGDNFEAFKCCLGAYAHWWIWLNITIWQNLPTFNKFVLNGEVTFECCFQAYIHWWVSFNITKGHLHACGKFV